MVTNNMFYAFFLMVQKYVKWDYITTVDKFLEVFDDNGEWLTQGDD